MSTSTTYASTIRTKYYMELLKVAKGRMVADKFAGKSKMSRGEGGTVRWNKILRPTKQETVSTAGTLITAGQASDLTSNYKEASMEIWGDSFKFNEDVQITSFIKDKQNQEVIGNHMARSLEYQIIKKMSTGCFRHRIDKDATYVASSACTANSTTTSLEGGTGLVTTSDDKNGGYVTITNPSGPGYDECSLITDSTHTTADTLAVVFTQAPTAASYCHLTVGTGIVTTDVMTTTALMDCSGRHELFETEKFDGNMYRMFLHAAQHRDLWDDTTFSNSAIYDASDRFKNYKIGRWFDIEFLISSELYREDVDGTENQATGVVHVSPCFGSKAYEVVSFANPGGSGAFAVKFIAVDTADSQNLRNSAKFLSWKGTYAAAVTRATSIIGVMSGATDMGITVA